MTIKALAQFIKEQFGTEGVKELVQELTDEQVEKENCCCQYYHLGRKEQCGCEVHQCPQSKQSPQPSLPEIKDFVFDTTGLSPEMVNALVELEKRQNAIIRFLKSKQ